MDRSVPLTVPPGGTLPFARRGIGRRLRLWCDLWSERRALRSLDSRLLRDIGVDPDAAEREATRRLWDVPPSRLQDS